MNLKLRPLPYDTPVDRAKGIRFWMEFGGMSLLAATRHIAKARRDAMRIPMPGEICGAHARTTGQPCQAPAGPNGRCKLHGGRSTGPKTVEGKARTMEALQAGLRLWRSSHRADELPELSAEI